MKRSCLFVGYGQIASRVAEALKDQYAISILKRFALAQQPAYIEKCYLGDVVNPDIWSEIPCSFDLVLVCLTPSGRGEDAYRHIFYDGLQACLRHFSEVKGGPTIVFVSSTSVYAQQDGAVYDEDSLAEGASATSKILRESEQLLEQSGSRHIIVRFSGIYGGSRTRLIEQVLRREAVLSAQARISNRIHEDDAVAFLVFCLQRAEHETLAPLYVATDSQPSELNEVYRFIAEELNIPINESLVNSVSRRSGNKRLSNQRMLETGFRLRYDSYQEGYRAMIKALDIKS